MKLGVTVVLVGLEKTTHLNGKVAQIVGKDEEEDRWLVHLAKISGNTVKFIHFNAFCKEMLTVMLFADYFSERSEYGGDNISQLLVKCS